MGGVAVRSQRFGQLCLNLQQQIALAMQLFQERAQMAVIAEKCTQGLGFVDAFHRQGGFRFRAVGSGRRVNQGPDTGKP